VRPPPSPSLDSSFTDSSLAPFCSGCVVFGRVAGDTAASYLLKNLSSGSGAVARLGQVNNHLQPPSTTISIDPATQQVHLTLNWSGSSGASSSASAAGEVKPTGPSTAEQPANEVDAAVKHDEETKAGEKKGAELKEYSLDEVAKHNTKDDIWVRSSLSLRRSFSRPRLVLTCSLSPRSQIAVNGQVLDVTNFMQDHPGGAKGTCTSLSRSRSLRVEEASEAER